MVLYSKCCTKRILWCLHQKDTVVRYRYQKDTVILVPVVSNIIICTVVPTSSVWTLTARRVASSAAATT
jgi:hypothetical protein